MAYQGFIDIYADCIGDLLRAITVGFANEPIRLALWLVDEYDLSQLSAVQLKLSASPFAGSNSQLAGTGYLLSVERSSVESLVNVLTDEEQLDCNIMHLELEIGDKVAIATYDTFNCAAFNDPITTTFLETLKQQDIINDYGFC
ncbi:MAG: hypothetical protein AAF821_04410 [Cyanobacteria bacterium P01_D01_bin.156]